MSGFFDGTLTFGTTPSLVTAGGLDCWVAKLTADATPIWAVRFGGTGNDRGAQVVVDSAGDVYVAGNFQDQIAFDAVNLVSAGMSDVFVAKLRGTNGSVIWATSLGSSGEDAVSDIAIHAAGRLIVSGGISGPLSPGEAYAGGTDAFVVAFEETGVRRWAKIIGASGNDGSSAVSAGTDAIYAGVSVSGAVDLGVPLIGAGSPTGLLLKIEP